MENDNKTTYDETLTVTSLIEPLQPNKVQDKPCTSREAQNLNFNQASTGTLPTTVQLIISVNAHRLRPMMHSKLSCRSLR